MLHHPEYRSRYAANLKRELPRIPFLGASSAESREGRQNLARHVSAENTDSQASESRQGRQSIARNVSAGNSAVDGPESRRDGTLVTQGASPGDAAKKESPSSLPKAGASGPPSRDVFPRDGVIVQPPAAERHKEIFWEFAKAGNNLADIHVHYEQQPQYPLEKLWNPTAKLDYRVTKMRLSNKDKSILFYNDALTLKGIPLETYESRLGNRSALEWVIDQYQVSTDKRSGITNDPNRPDDREYILRLIGQVITVSLETVKIVKSLPDFVIADSAAAAGA